MVGAKRRKLKVRWYGDGERRVRVVSGVGQWYKSGKDLVELRWVYVEDAQGTHRPQYFYCTDANVSTQWIVETYTSRWNIETTFQECRAYLGVGETKGHCARTVRRAEPCLFGLYGLVALLYRRLPQVYREKSWVLWTGKESRTFSDAISAVRHWLWERGVFERAGEEGRVQKLPDDIREMLLHALAPIA